MLTADLRTTPIETTSLIFYKLEHNAFENEIRRRRRTPNMVPRMRWVHEERLGLIRRLTETAIESHEVISDQVRRRAKGSDTMGYYIAIYNARVS